MDHDEQVDDHNNKGWSTAPGVVNSEEIDSIEKVSSHVDSMGNNMQKEEDDFM